MRSFFTSDSHFGHDHIIRHGKRPFQDGAQMDRALMDAWNSVVSPGDVVYPLGGFFYASSGDRQRPAQKAARH